MNHGFRYSSPNSLRISKRKLLQEIKKITNISFEMRSTILFGLVFLTAYATATPYEPSADTFSVILEHQGPVADATESEIIDFTSEGVAPKCCTPGRCWDECYLRLGPRLRRAGCTSCNRCVCYV